jgi:hypothetical protein
MAIKTFEVAKHFLPALINADVTGLTLEDEKQLDLWVAKQKLGYVKVNSEEGDDSDYGICDICGLGAELATITIISWEK